MKSISLRLNSLFGKGRKRNDYSLTFEPITAPKQTAVTIECKQYRKVNSKNFVDALSDYANGRPYSKVILLSYSHIPKGLFKRIDDDLREMTLPIGNFLPNNLTAEEWQWPVDWNPSWNCHIINNSKSRESREFDLHSTQTAVAVQKCLLGENTKIKLDWYTRELISKLYNIFLNNDRFKALPKLIPILKSYDLPVDLRLIQVEEKQSYYDIDGFLGEYALPGGGREVKVQLFVKAINQCAQQLSLNKYHLMNIVIIHELSPALLTTSFDKLMINSSGQSRQSKA